MWRSLPALEKLTPRVHNAVHRICACKPFIKHFNYSALNLMEGKEFAIEKYGEPYPLLSAKQDEDVEIKFEDNIPQKNKIYIEDFQEALDAVTAMDSLLKETAEEHVFPSFLESATAPNSFEYLARSVISQQVSGYAAKAIVGRVMDLFSGDFPTPAQILETQFDTLKAAGLSTRKTEYIISLAENYAEGQLSDEKLISASDDEVVDMIVSIRGFGPWTAQMFLLFWLKRMDVFSPGDLGVQRGYKRYVKLRPEILDQAQKVVVDLDDQKFKPPGTSAKALKREKLPKELEHMTAVASLFSPYRSALQMILWKLSDIVMDAVELRAPKNGGKRKPGEPEVKTEEKVETANKKRRVQKKAGPAAKKAAVK